MTGYQAYQTAEKQKRDALVQNHLPLVYSIARHIINATTLRTLELSDLVQSGVIGLYRAIDKFDERRGTSFGSFAAHHVRGAMLDELQKTSQIPRGLREKQVKIKKALDALGQRLLREPSDEEVASYLELSLENYTSWLIDLGWTTVWSIEDLEGSEGNRVPDSDVAVNPSAAYGKREQRAELIQALRKLSEREQKVLALYYQEELTLKEIGYILDLSESQISRIHSKAILKLRRWIEEE